MHHARVCVFLGGCLLAGLARSPAGEEGVPVKVEPLQVRAESRTIQPGAPLSARALVTHPPAIRGLLSWTVETRRHRGPMYGHSPSPNGRLVATGGLDGTIRIWNLDDGQLLRVLVGHDTYSGSVAWSPCGTVIASTGTLGRQRAPVGAEVGPAAAGVPGLEEPRGARRLVPRRSPAGRLVRHQRRDLDVGCPLEQGGDHRRDRPLHRGAGLVAGRQAAGRAVLSIGPGGDRHGGWQVLRLRQLLRLQQAR